LEPSCTTMISLACNSKIADRFRTLTLIVTLDAMVDVKYCWGNVMPLGMKHICDLITKNMPDLKELRIHLEADFAKTLLRLGRSEDEDLQILSPLAACSGEAVTVFIGAHLPSEGCGDGQEWSRCAQLFCKHSNTQKASWRYIRSTLVLS